MKRSFYRMLCCLTLLLASCALLAVGASAADPVRDFDFARYASDNPDLMRAYGPELYQDERYQHFPCMCPVHLHMSAGRDFFDSLPRPLMGRGFCIAPKQNLKLFLIYILTTRTFCVTI